MNLIIAVNIKRTNNNKNCEANIFRPINMLKAVVETLQLKLRFFRYFPKYVVTTNFEFPFNIAKTKILIKS